MCPPSHLSPLPPGCPSTLTLSALFHALNLDWWSISHMVIYMFQWQVDSLPIELQGKPLLLHNFPLFPEVQHAGLSQPHLIECARILFCLRTLRKAVPSIYSMLLKHLVPCKPFLNLSFKIFLKSHILEEILSDKLVRALSNMHSDNNAFFFPSSYLLELWLNHQKWHVFSFW